MNKSCRSSWKKCCEIVLSAFTLLGSSYSFADEPVLCGLSGDRSNVLKDNKAFGLVGKIDDRGIVVTYAFKKDKKNNCLEKFTKCSVSPKLNNRFGCNMCLTLDVAKKKEIINLDWDYTWYSQDKHENILEMFVLKIPRDNDKNGKLIGGYVNMDKNHFYVGEIAAYEVVYPYTPNSSIKLEVGKRS